MMFHRLAINGLNPQSGQPLTINNDNNKLLICNGEIYNYKVLADKYDITLETKVIVKLFFIYIINLLLIFLLMN